MQGFVLCAIPIHHTFFIHTHTSYIFIRIHSFTLASKLPIDSDSAEQSYVATDRPLGVIGEEEVWWEGVGGEGAGGGSIIGRSG